MLLGPSGCGKTTLLRAIAGLGMADDGRISIGDRDVTYLPPRERGISMVFQSYAIFPHMKVYDNIAFGLKMQKMRQGRDQTAACARRPSCCTSKRCWTATRRKMSGGQRQRVAVARAIAMQSQVLLMDEPLSNLDALLRLEMRAELKRLLAEIRRHDDLRHPRPDRGAEHGRPHRRDARRASSSSATRPRPSTTMPGQPVSSAVSSAPRR